MSLVKRFITYQIPEDSGYNLLKIFESASEDGTYTLLDTLNYTYPNRATEYSAINTIKWYKIQFFNSTDGFSSPLSSPFFGGHYDDEAQFATITSTFDGAGFATVSGFYSTTNLNPDQIDVGDVSDAMRLARAYIDLVTYDQSPYKYSKNFGLETTRRKYNASIEVIKRSEIYFAAALIYQDMADDRTMMGLSGSITPILVPADLTSSGILPGSQLVVSGVATSISIGQTSINEPTTLDMIETARFNLDKELQIARYNNEKNLAFATYLDTRQTERYMKEATFFYNTSKTYANKANSLINTIKSPYIPITYGTSISTQKFMNPGSIYNFSYTNIATDSIFVNNVADLTGLGSSFSGAYYDLSAANMVANSVNGTLGVAVFPLESSTTLIDSRIVVNGVTYWLDNWTTNAGVVQPGHNGTTTSNDGFSLSFNTGAQYIKIKWNYTLANGGFNITNSDSITLTYWTI
jgi:hypothetical protein